MKFKELFLQDLVSSIFIVLKFIRIPREALIQPCWLQFFYFFPDFFILTSQDPRKTWSCGNYFFSSVPNYFVFSNEFP